MNIEYATLSEAGPRPRNEDSFLALEVGAGRYIFAVADGLGGMGAGEVASQLAVDFLRNKAKDISDNPEKIGDYIRDINKLISEKQKQNIKYSKMATTLSVVVIVDNYIYIGHVGDTRIALARGQGIKRLTKDQSEAQRLFDMGKLNKDDLKSYARKNILESALGAKEFVDVIDGRNTLSSGDYIIISSDGVHNKIFIREIKRIFSQLIVPDAIVEGIREEMSFRGPDDNYTCVVIRAL